MNIIEKISRLDEKQRETLITRIKADGERYGVYPLMPDQKTFLMRLAAGKPPVGELNLKFIVKMDGITRKRVEEVIDQLLYMHDVFRYRFVKINGEDFQYFDREAEPCIQDVNESSIDSFFHYEFDFSRDTGVRFGIMENYEQSFSLLIFMHHIIADGFSIGVVCRDIVRILNGTAEKSEYQYGSFACDMNSAQMQERRRQDIGYWCERLRGTDKFLDMPTDYSRSCSREDIEGTYGFTVDEEGYRKISDKAKQLKCNMYNVLSSVFSIVMMKMTSREDMVMAMTSFNRSDEKISGLVGDFAAFLPLVYECSDEMSIDGYIVKNARQMQEDLGHGVFIPMDIQSRFPYEYLQNVFPLYQVMFAFHSSSMHGGMTHEAGGVKLSIEDYNIRDVGRILMDLIVRADDTGSSLNVYISYNSKIFAPETIRNIADIYAEALDSAVSGSEMTIGELVLSGRGVRHVSGEVPEGLRPVRMDIAESGRLHTDGADICLADERGKPVPAGFYGRILVDEDGTWHETGKAGYIDHEDRLVISERRKYLMRKGDAILDLDELRASLTERYPEAEISLSACSGKMVMMYDGVKAAGRGMHGLMEDADAAGTGSACAGGCDALREEDAGDGTAVHRGSPVQACAACGYEPDIVMDTMRMRQKNTIDFVSAAAEAMTVLEEAGCSVRFEQRGYNSGDIIISGYDGDEAEIVEIAERSGTEKLGFCIADDGCGQLPSGTVQEDGERDLAQRITKRISERASEINDMWADITQNSSCGCFEDFYESGGLKIYDMMLALNRRYGLHLKIFDMFRMNTPAKIADFIDQIREI